MKKYILIVYDFLYSFFHRLYIRLFFRLRIMSTEQTIRYILREDCSVARFGDGELDQMFKPKDIGFQIFTPELSRSLEQVLHNKTNKLLICMPKYINGVSGLNKQAEDFWIKWGENGYHETVVRQIRKICGQRYLFGNTQMTRPYIDYQSVKKANKIFVLLKKIWEKKNVLIVEGSQSCLGVGNDLFTNTNSLKRIIVPAKNAFDYFDDIVEAVINHVEQRLVLLAVGPTATVLASELCNRGIQAIDVGHIDIEYEWFLRKATSKIAIIGKFTNEAENGVSLGTNCQDSVYLNQVVDRIGC